MIDIGEIRTRTIPATPRSKDYPQGYYNQYRYTNSNNVKTTNTEVESRAASNADLLQFIRNNREAVIAALLDDEGNLTVDGTIRVTGTITEGYKTE